jgi:hypothetical protein
MLHVVTFRELVKELRYAEDAALTVIGTDIQWLPGMVSVTFNVLLGSAFM